MSFVWFIITEYRLGWRLLGWASWSKMKGAFRGRRVALVVKQLLRLVMRRNLNPGFPCLLDVVFLGFISFFSLSSSKFKNSVFLPSAVYGVVSLLSTYALLAIPVPRFEIEPGCVPALRLCSICQAVQMARY